MIGFVKRLWPSGVMSADGASSGTSVPVGAVVALCALILVLPVAIAADGHELGYDGENNWIHHHTTNYRFCNEISTSNEAQLHTAGDNAAGSWSNLSTTGVTVTEQSTCHPSSGAAANIELRAANYGDTSWRMTVWNDSPSPAAYHATHTHMLFNREKLTGSNIGSYQRRTLACKGFGLVMGLQALSETENANADHLGSGGVNRDKRDCMSFRGSFVNEKSKDDYPSSYDYTNVPAAHSRAMLKDAYGSHEGPKLALSGTLGDQILNSEVVVLESSAHLAVQAQAESGISVVTSLEVRLQDELVAFGVCASSVTCDLSPNPWTMTVDDYDVGEYELTIRAVDSAGFTTERSYAVQVVRAPEISGNVVNVETFGTAYIDWETAQGADPGTPEPASGGSEYEVKVWPASIAEPCQDEPCSDPEYGFHSTDSPFSHYNLSIGTNFATSGSENGWKYRVRMRSASGTPSTPSALGSIGGSSTSTFNAVLGTSANPTATSFGRGISVDHASGNLSIESVVASELLGPDSRDLELTYNSQDSRRDISLLDHSTPLSSTSTYRHGSLGFGITATWEQRLSKADDGKITHGGHEMGNPPDSVVEKFTALDYIDDTGRHHALNAVSGSGEVLATGPASELDAVLRYMDDNPLDPCTTGDVYLLHVKSDAIYCFTATGVVSAVHPEKRPGIVFVRNPLKGDRVERVESAVSGGGGQPPLGADLVWGEMEIGSTTYGWVDANQRERIAAIEDNEGRQIRFEYHEVGDNPVVVGASRFSDDQSTTLLERATFDWTQSPSTGRPVLMGASWWVSKDDPSTSQVGDLQSHTWHFAYDGDGRTSLVTEEAASAMETPDSSELIPEVYRLHTQLMYGASSESTSSSEVSVSSYNAHFSEYGTWKYDLDYLGRTLVKEWPTEWSDSDGPLVETFKYDSTGGVREVADVDDTKTTYARDGQGRLIEVVTFDGNNIPIAASEHSNFDDLQNPQRSRHAVSLAGDFQIFWHYEPGACVRGGDQSFIVTSGGDTGSRPPDWPTLVGAQASSGSVTFERTDCEPDPAYIEYEATFDDSGRNTSLSVEGGAVQCSFYDEYGRDVLVFSRTSGPCPETASTSSAIPGTVIRNTYDERGLLVEQESNEEVRTFAHDASGLVVSETLNEQFGPGSGSELRFSYTHDGAGRVIEQVTIRDQGVPAVSTFDVNYDGEQTQSVVPSSAAPTGLDTNGDPSGDESEIWYNDRGMPTLEILNGTTMSSTYYDPRGLVVWEGIARPFGVVSEHGAVSTYHLSGEVKTYSDPWGSLKEYESAGTAADLPVAVTSAMSGTQLFAYNQSGDLREFEWELGSRQLEFDSQDFQVSDHVSGVGHESTFYDTEGRLRSTIYSPSVGPEVFTERAYDNYGRLRSVSHTGDDLDTEIEYGSTHSVPTEITTGNDLVSGAELRELGSQGQVSAQVFWDGNSASTERRFAYVYDGVAGQDSTVAMPNGIEVTRNRGFDGAPEEFIVKDTSTNEVRRNELLTYDGLGRLSELESSTASDISYTYDDLGQLASVQLENGLKWFYRYNDATGPGTLQTVGLFATEAPSGALSANRVQEIEGCLSYARTCVAADGEDIQREMKALLSSDGVEDLSSAVGTRADLLRWMRLRDGRSWEPTTAVLPGTCVEGGSGEYFTAGNAGVSGTAPPDWSNGSPVADGSVVWSAEDCMPQFVFTELEHSDESGMEHRLVEQSFWDRESRRYAYGSAGRLTEVEVNNDSIAFDFDAQGRYTTLISESLSEYEVAWRDLGHQPSSWRSPDVEVSIRYDGFGRVRAIDHVGGSAVEYVYDYENNPVAAVVDGDWLYFELSEAGHLVGIRDEEGDLVASATYSPWGLIRAENQELLKTVALSYDAKHGTLWLGEDLYLMGARIYSSSQLRFLSPEPLVQAPALADGYAYSGNDPVNYTDPTGNLSVIRLNRIGLDHAKMALNTSKMKRCKKFSVSSVCKYMYNEEVKGAVASQAFGHYPSLHKNGNRQDALRHALWNAWTVWDILVNGRGALSRASAQKLSVKASAANERLHKNLTQKERSAIRMDIYNNAHGAQVTKRTDDAGSIMRKLKSRIGQCKLRMLDDGKLVDTCN